MAVKKAGKEEATKKEFIDVKYSGDTFEWSVRVYPGIEGTGNVVSRHALGITLNDVFSVKGCKLIETADKYFISWPQYAKEGKDGGYVSYIYTAKDLNEEIDKLVLKISQEIAKEGEF